MQGKSVSNWSPRSTTRPAVTRLAGIGARRTPVTYTNSSASNEKLQPPIVDSAEPTWPRTPGEEVPPEVDVGHWCESKSLWMDRKIQHEMGEHREPNGGTYEPAFG